MKERKITDKYFILLPELKNLISDKNEEADNVLKFRVSKKGDIVKYRRNTKDLNVVRKRIKDEFYKYDEFIRSVVDAILEDLDL